MGRHSAIGKWSCAMSASPVVRVRLHLGRDFAALIEAEGPFRIGLRQALEAELAERMAALGVPGVSSVEILVDASRPVQWFVNDQECDYPDEMPASIWSCVRGEIPGPLDMDDGRGWLTPILTANPAAQVAEFFRHLLNAVLEPRPSVLMGRLQLEAYLVRLIEAGFPENAINSVDWFAPVLGNVLDMGNSIAHVSRLVPILRDGMIRGREPSDLAEDLVAELALESIAIEASREFIQRFSLSQASGEQLFPMMRDGLFF